MICDFRSDTLTRPTSKMLEAMFSAEVGDDVFEEDPTVNALESKVADLFGMEAALFCPSGTMTNQIAIKAHTQPGDEVICNDLAHIYRYEGGGIAFNSGTSVRLIPGERGRITASQIKAQINPDDVHFPVSKLVALENTSNKGGGSCYGEFELSAISNLCKTEKLPLHLDGARLFNALVHTGHEPQQYGSWFDSISICLSKGLGAPVGSLLLGEKGFIRKARRIRKVFGGGMRQAGYLAAAGIYALDHHVNRLKSDHEKASILGHELSQLSWVEEVITPETNIVIFSIIDRLNPEAFLNQLKEVGIIAVPFGPQQIRLVTHLDITDEMMNYTMDQLKKIKC